MSMVLPTGPRGQALAVGLVVAVGVVAWLGAVAPLLDWHAERVDQLERDRSLLARMEGLADAVPALRQQALAPAAALPPAALLGGATDAIAGAALQQRVAALAGEAGATLASAETLPAEAAGAYRRIGVHVTLTAPWPQLVHLIEAIELSAGGMLLDDMQLRNTATARSGQAPLDASFTVVGFRSGAATAARRAP